MKIIYSITAFIILFCTTTIAQKPVDSSHIDTSPTKPMKAIVHFEKDSVLSGKVVTIKDNYLLLAAVNKDNLTYHSISLTQIKMVKVKRNKFLLGLGFGAVLGGLAGYGVGAITYQYDYSRSESDNNDYKKSRAAIGAFIASVPSALLGGLIGSVAIRARFIIKGDKNNMKKMIHRLWEFQ